MHTRHVHINCRQWLLQTLGMMMFGCLSLSVMAADHKDDLSYWLLRFNTAAKTQNYHGVAHYYRYGETSLPIRIVHTVDDGVEQAAVETEKRGVRQVRWEKGRVKAYIEQPDGQVQSVRLTQEVSLKSLQPDRMALMSQCYRVGERGQDRVLGRMTDRVLIASVDQDRYSYKAWIDQQTGVLLRGELVDLGGQVIEGFAYRNIHFGKPDKDQMITLTPTEDKTSSASILSNQEVAQQWKIGFLPRGFINSAQMKRQFGEHNVEQMLFSDGINTFSVFFRRLNAGETCSQNTEVGRYSPANVVVREIAGHEVVLVGQMPLAALTKIADGIRFERHD